MKIYVDLSCDKVSGQQHMQHALKNYVVEHGLFAEKEDADVLVYVQVPFDETLYDEWKRYKEQNKLIVFIHHYMSESFYSRCAIFKVHDLFELIDYHICISDKCELYTYLCSKISKDRIFTQELATAEYTKLQKYFKTPTQKVKNSICFVGKAIKGIDKFVDFCLKNSFDKAVILCPDAEKCTHDLTAFEVYTNKRFDDVYAIMSDCQYIYCPSVYNTPPMHLETVLQEAIPCGCVPIVDKAYKQIMQTDDLSTVGFIQEDAFDQNTIADIDLSIYQTNAKTMQNKQYKTLSETQESIVNYIMNVYKHA